MDLIKGLMIVFLSLLCLTNGLLIRNNEVYKSIISDIYKYFYCKSIVFIHAIPEQELFQEIRLTTQLFKLRKYFNKHCIPTVVININKIISEFGDELSRLSRPLFVLLNDSHELRVQLATSLAPEMDMSRAKWLLFMNNSTNLEHFFKDIYIPINCEFCVSQQKPITDYEEIITEIYRVGFGTELRQELLASWHPITGTQLPKISLYYIRPRNLHMYTLHAQKINPQSLRSEVSLTKFTDEVLNSLQSSMSFTFNFKEAHNKGHCWSNRTCDGAIGALVSQSTDFIGNLLNPDKSSDVWKLFDITHPIISFRRNLFIKRLSNHFSWVKFFRPFKYNIWIVIVLLIFTISGFLIFIEYHHINKNNLPQSRRILHHSAFSRTLDSLFFVIGALCNQGMVFSRVTSILIVQFTICITSVVIFASYSAVLISSLTHNVYVPPFTNLAGLLEDGSYEVKVVQNSTTYWFFETSDDELIKKTYERFMQNTDTLPQIHSEDKSRLCHQDNYASVFPNVVLLEYQAPDCPVVRLESITVTSLFFFLQRNSPYREFINRQILFSRERNGLNRFFIHLRQLVNPIENYTEISVEFHDIAPLLIVHLSGVILSCVILFIERGIYQNNQRRQCKLDEQKIIYNYLIAKARFSLRPQIYGLKDKRMKKKKIHSTARLWREKFNQTCL